MTSSCWLELGDLLVMDGQCQDDFIHCTNPVSEQERINVTFSSIRQHATSCSLLRTGLACSLPTCAQGSSVPFPELVENGACWAFWVLLGILCLWRVPALLVYPSCLQDLGYAGVLVAGHFFGGGRWWHFHRGSLRVHQRAWRIRDCSAYHDGVLLKMLASVRLLSLHD